MHFVMFMVDMRPVLLVVLMVRIWFNSVFMALNPVVRHPTYPSLVANAPDCRSDDSHTA